MHLVFARLITMWRHSSKRQKECVSHLSELECDQSKNTAVLFLVLYCYCLYCYNADLRLGLFTEL
jgi:hypothetical protein